MKAGVMALALMVSAPVSGCKDAWDVAPFPRAADGSCPEGTSPVASVCIARKDAEGRDVNPLGSECRGYFYSPVYGSSDCTPSSAPCVGGICSAECDSLGGGCGVSGITCAKIKYNESVTGGYVGRDAMVCVVECNPTAAGRECPPGRYCKPAINVTGIQQAGYCSIGAAAQTGEKCHDDGDCSGTLYCPFGANTEALCEPGP